MKSLSDRQVNLDKNICLEEISAVTKRTQPKIDRVLLISWLFLIGSLIFMLDAIVEINESISFHAILHFSASFLFTIGSILFIPND